MIATTSTPYRRHDRRRSTRNSRARTLTATTTNVMPIEPAIEARGSRKGSSTCETPRPPQEKPPSGQTPRTCSMSVHAAATPATRSVRERPRNRILAMSAKATMKRASNSTRDTNAASPNRMIHDRSSPKAETPDAKPNRAARDGVAPLITQSSGTRARKAIGHAPIGGKAIASATPDAHEAPRPVMSACDGAILPDSRSSCESPRRVGSDLRSEQFLVITCVISAAAARLIPRPARPRAARGSWRRTLPRSSVAAGCRR